jgi:hypothetical protein
MVRTGPLREVAIIGGGFAGLSVAAGLLKKSAYAKITMFEQCDTLLPLQQGSDSRWLHPHIYDWPADGSEASAAMLPVMNWTAARASDVVVQVLGEWKRVLAEATREKPQLYCNARHLQIYEEKPGATQLRIEWVGEKRDPIGGTVEGDKPAVGRSQTFDVVILAVGFGQERDGALSYWRNETLAQPTLDQTRLNYIVSGQGDGAMIDLSRLRVSQFRQDRILSELFHDIPDLLQSFKQLQQRHSGKHPRPGLFEALESLSQHRAKEFEEVYARLSRRLRRDTEVILRLKVKKISELFDPARTRISFQNKLFVYLLYKCGGFFPSSLRTEVLMQQHTIPRARVIRRHGTLREAHLRGFLPQALYERVRAASRSTASQSEEMLWTGGYFGFPGRSADASKLPDEIKAGWRKEYLPGPTALLATTFCAAVSGVLRQRHPRDKRLRITLHRAVVLGAEELLQQASDYVGTEGALGKESTAARTFPARNATIGLAYSCRQIVRSARNVDPSALNAAMQSLQLNEASRAMSADVRFVLAIPVLGAGHPDRRSGPHAVAGILYVDSTAEGFFVDNSLLQTLVSMAQGLLDGLENMQRDSLNRIQNAPLVGDAGSPTAAPALPATVSGILEFVPLVTPPKASGPFCLNFDYSDFIPTQ